MWKMISVVLTVIAALGIWQYQSHRHSETPNTSRIRLAATTCTVGSGLMDTLIPLFEADGRYQVEIISTGTGAALDLGRQGKVDVVLVHARAAEDAFVKAGYGINRRDVMYNQFIIVGPKNDELSSENCRDVLVILRSIHDADASFISRGDNSGTHIREQELWRACELEPAGKWYTKSNAGMLETLLQTSEQRAYTLTTASTFLFNQSSLDLTIVCHGDSRLINPYGVIAVNPTTVPGVNFRGAMAFIEFLTSEVGQNAIAAHGKPRFKMSLFEPLVRR